MRQEVSTIVDCCLAAIGRGDGFEQGLREFAASGDGVFPVAVAGMLDRIDAGARRREALQQLATEMRDPDLTHLANLVIAADESGASIADLLVSLAPPGSGE